MEEEIGIITHYFGKVSVGVIELKKGKLTVGDTIHIKGHTTDLIQKINSLQIEHDQVDSISPGESAGLKVDDHVREHDLVFKVTED